MQPPTLTTLTAELRTSAAHSRCAPLKTGRRSATRSSCAAASVSAAQLSDADDEVHDQDQFERRALVARATAPGRTVNSQ